MTSAKVLDQHSYPPECPSPGVCTTSPQRSPSFGACALSPPRGVASWRPGLPDRMFAWAADVFQAAQAERSGAIVYAPSTLAPPTGGANPKRAELWAYQLAFSALKYQELLEDVLIDSSFGASQQMPDDLMALVVVMLYDFQDRKFQSREPMAEDGEVPIKEVRRVEGSLFRLRTKLAASLARSRIKKNLPSIDDTLPMCVRAKHQRKHVLPICAWVNTLKTSVDEVCETLKAEGFVQRDPHILEGRVFSKDTHCPDVLRFPQQVRGLLDATTLLTEHKLIIQEKSRSLAACAVRPLLVKGADILIVGSFSAHTVAHVAVLASACSAHIYLCGYPDDPTEGEELQSTLSTIGCKNVHLLPGRFGELNEWDSRLQKVRVVLLLPRCSVSALCDPVAHILQEDGDRDLLCDLSQGFVSDAKLQSLVTRQRQDLSHVFTFPKVRAVVYCTCSVYAEENATLVESTLEKAVVRPKLRPFRITSAGWTVKTDEKFFQLQESDTTDGCFLCVLKREDPVEPESIQNILARAAAKGLLGGLTASESTEHTKPREGQVERERERKRERKRERHRHAPDSLPPTNTARLLNDSSVDTAQFPTAPDGPMVASDGTSPSPALKLPPQDPEDARLSSSVSAVLNGASEVEGQQLKSHRRRSRARRHTRLHPGHETLRHWWAKHASVQKGPVAHRSHAARKKPRNLPGGRKAEQEAPSPRTGSPELAQAHKPLPPVSPPRSSPLSSGSSLRRPHLSDKSANTAPLESSGSSDSRDSVLVSSRS